MPGLNEISDWKCLPLARRKAEMRRVTIKRAWVRFERVQPSKRLLEEQDDPGLIPALTKCFYLLRYKVVVKKLRTCRSKVVCLSALS